MEIVYIVDAHLHFSAVAAFHQGAVIAGVDYSWEGLVEELRKAEVVAAVAMGLAESKVGAFPDHEAPNPMGLDLAGDCPDKVYYCPGINPNRLKTGGKQELLLIESALKDERTVGIKLYPGYYPYYVSDHLYKPVFELAAAYRLPVIIHSGDTYSERGLLKYGHPLHLDEVATQYRHVKFLLAHLGDPWVMDAAELIYKNENVFGDLSGFITGNINAIERYRTEPLFKDHFRRALIYADDYEKILFGSDWPLVPIAPYRDFVLELVPQEHYEKVFFKNALSLFRRMKIE